MEKQNNIGIVGFGVLGKSLSYVFSKKFKMFIYDKFQEEYSNNLSDLVKNSEIIFVSVPTPMQEFGEIDLDYVNDSLISISEEVRKQNKNPIIVLRSTIVPETTEKLQKIYIS